MLQTEDSLSCIALDPLFLKHGNPPPNGGGLLHERVRIFFPLPQVTVQGLYPLQDPQPPSNFGNFGFCVV